MDQSKRTMCLPRSDRGQLFLATLVRNQSLQSYCTLSTKGKTWRGRKLHYYCEHLLKINLRKILGCSFPQLLAKHILSMKLRTISAPAKLFLEACHIRVGKRKKRPARNVRKAVMSTNSRHLESRIHANWDRRAVSLQTPSTNYY